MLPDNIRHVDIFAVNKDIVTLIWILIIYNKLIIMDPSSRLDRDLHIIASPVRPCMWETNPKK